MAEESLSSKIANELRQMIVTEKKYLPGDKLPNERTLALMFNVSRPAVREGIKYLVAEGFLEIRRGVGTFVSEEMLFGTSDSSKFSERQKKVLNDWYEARKIWEVGAIRLAVRNATKEDIINLEKIVIKTNDLIEDNDMSFFKMDFEFHRALAAATGNEIIERYISKMGEWQWAYFSMTKTSAKGDEVIISRMKKNSLENHMKILQFIRDKDEEGAMLAMRYHLLCAQKDLEV